MYRNGSNVQTIADLMRAWFAEYVERRSPDSAIREEHKLSRFTIRGYKTFCKQVITHGGDLQLATLKSSDMNRLRETLEEHFGTRTIIQILGRLEQAITWGRRNGITIPEVEIIKPVRRKDRDFVREKYTPSPAEVESLYQEIRNSRLKLGLLIGWYTGARPGEIGELSWKDIYQDDKGYWIRLVGKTGAQKFPITEEQFQAIMAFLKEDASPDDRLFRDHFRINATSQLQESCKLRGMTPFGFYGLRRMKVDALMRNHVEPKTYERLMGHSFTVGLEIYRQVSDDDLQEVVGGSKTVDLEGELRGLGVSPKEALEMLRVWWIRGCEPHGSPLALCAL